MNTDTGAIANSRDTWIGHTSVYDSRILSNKDICWLGGEGALPRVIERGRLENSAVLLCVYDMSKYYSCTKCMGSACSRAFQRFLAMRLVQQ